MKPPHPPRTRVALYLRRSTDTHQEESLETQRRGALDYCAARGWTVVEEFVDSGVSRAEFKKRPGLIRMLNRAPSKAFDLVVMRDESRLGGDISRTGLVIQDLTDAGVGIVHYISDELVSAEGAVDKFLIAARNFASELEREKISSRTHEHLLQKAKSGRPAGGISYGYRIVDGAYVVDEHQAEIVRRFFRMYADGEGHRSIARTLNAEGIAAPRAGKRGTGSWAPSAIRAMLTNPRYAGQARYNQTRKLYRGGTKVREDRPAADHVTYQCPAVIDPALYSRVEQRFSSNKRFGGVRATKGAAARYLLTGHLRCAVCSGPVTVANRRRGRVNTRVYVCGWRRDRGSSVCSNTAASLVAELDHAVVEGIRAMLTDDVVTDVLRELRSVLRGRLEQQPQEALKLATEAAQLRREVQRLTAALASTDDPPSSVIKMISDKERRLRQVEQQLSSQTAAITSVERELDSMEQNARARLADLHAMFERSPEGSRALLSRLTSAEKLRFRKTQRGVLVEGPMQIPELLVPGIASDPDCVASPAGFEPASPT